MGSSVSTRNVVALGGVDHHRVLALRLLPGRDGLHVDDVLHVDVSPCGMAHAMTATAFPGLCRGYTRSLLLLYEVSFGMAY